MTHLLFLLAVCGLFAGCTGPEYSYVRSGTPTMKLEFRRASVRAWCPQSRIIPLDIKKNKQGKDAHCVRPLLLDVLPFQFLGRLISRLVNRMTLFPCALIQEINQIQRHPQLGFESHILWEGNFLGEFGSRPI